MAKSSGGGGRSGRIGRIGGNTLPNGIKLATGFKFGGSLSPSSGSLQVGDDIIVRTARISATGTISKVNRTTVEVSSSVFGKPVSYRLSMGDMSGGTLSRGKQVYQLV